MFFMVKKLPNFLITFMIMVAMPLGSYPLYKELRRL